MEDRYAQILSGAINLYIQTAKPVSSSALLRKYGWSISPATVRAVLQELDEEGFLFQPHTSAGRIPTDKGYRFYVNRLQSQQVAEEERQRLRRQLEELASRYQHLASSTSRLLSHLVHTVAVCSVPRIQDTREAGLAELMRQPDENIVEAVREVSLILDQADSFLNSLVDEETLDSAIFIGEENPFIPARHTSLVARAVEVPRYGQVVLCIIGPKRMPYRRNVALLKALTDIMEDENL